MRSLEQGEGDGRTSLNALTGLRFLLDRKPAFSILRNASSTSSPTTFGTTTIDSDDCAAGCGMSTGFDSFAGQGGGDQRMG